jgi:hypothetical protein
MPSLDGRCILCVSLFLCSPLFASSLPLEPLQLALLRRSLKLCLRHRSPAPSTSSGSGRHFVRSWQATARPRVSGSAVGSSATLIASNVIALSADPFGSQSPPLGNLGRAFVFAFGLGLIGVASWPLPLTARLPPRSVLLQPRGLPGNKTGRRGIPPAGDLAAAVAVCRTCRRAARRIDRVHSPPLSSLGWQRADHRGSVQYAIVMDV